MIKEMVFAIIFDIVFFALGLMLGYVLWKSGAPCG